MEGRKPKPPQITPALPGLGHPNPPEKTPAEIRFRQTMCEAQGENSSSSKTRATGTLLPASQLEVSPLKPPTTPRLLCRPQELHAAPLPSSTAQENAAPGTPLHRACSKGIPTPGCKPALRHLLTEPLFEQTAQRETISSQKLDSWTVFHPSSPQGRFLVSSDFMAGQGSHQSGHDLLRKAGSSFSS